MAIDPDVRRSGRVAHREGEVVVAGIGPIEVDDDGSPVY